MISQTVSTVGVKPTFLVPATVEEFDQNAKKVGACLQEAVNNVIYRGVLADFRATFCEEVEKDTGIERKWKTVERGKDKKAVEVWDETEGDYITRVIATKGWTEDRTSLQAIADRVAPTIIFDASVTEAKERGPKKLPEAYKTAAERIFTNGNEAKWAEKLKLTFGPEKDKNVELLGWAIKRVEDEKRKAAVEVEYQ